MIFSNEGEDNVQICRCANVQVKMMFKYANEMMSDDVFILHICTSPHLHIFRACSLINQPFSPLPGL